jgi:hypothetical protein
MDTVGMQQPRRLDLAKSTRGTGLSRAVSISTRRGAKVVEHGGYSAVRVRGFVVAELGED